MALSVALFANALARDRLGAMAPVRMDPPVVVVVSVRDEWRVPLPYVPLRWSAPYLGVKWVKIPWKWLGVGFACAGVCYTLWRVGWAGRTGRYVGYLWHTWSSWVVDCVSVRGNEGRRSMLSRYRNGKFMPPVAHSHPEAAGSRTGADYAMTDYIITTGAEPYDVSSASRNVGDGVRLYYTAKDYHIRYKNCPLRRSHIIKMVDVDYYVTAEEMADWLMGGNVVLLYTFVPPTAGGPVPDGNFTISGNKISMVIHGGARYEHELWDWDVDHFTIDTWCGLWVVAVDTVQVSDTRRVVQLTPQVWIPAPFSVTVPRSPLRRKVLHTASGKWAVVARVGPEGTQWTSVARAGTDYAVTLPSAAMEAMRVRHVYAKSQRNVGDIQAQLDVLVRKEVVKLNTGIAAPLLYEFFEENERVILPPQTLGASAPHYNPVEPLLHDVGRCYARVVGPPVVSGAAFPAVSRNNEVVTIADRVRAPRNTVVPGGKYRGYLNEFIVNLVPTVGGVSPVDVSEVMESQLRAAQRHRNEHIRTWLFNFRSLVQAFQKKEMGSGKIKAARNISTLPTGLNLQYATFVRAFKQTYLANQRWYVPGKTPPQIAAAVQRLCGTSTYVLSTDFSNLDGSKSAFLRDVYRACLLRAFPVDCGLAGLLDRMSNPRAVTHHGLEYDPGPSQLSGASDTTDNNTVCVGFYVYSCLRNFGFNARDAWVRLQDFQVCGDDVLMAVPQNVAATTANEVGLAVKVEEVPLGEPLPFLGRVFMDPWTSSASVQDPVRTLRKLHTTVADATRVTPEMALRWKCIGYLVNDRLTPLISHYCRNMLRLLDTTEEPLVDAPPEVIVDLPWWVQAGLMGETAGGVWPQEHSDRLWTVVASRLGVTEGELRQYCESLDVAESFAQVKPLSIMRPEVEVAAVVDGELVEPESEVPVEKQIARTMVAQRKHTTVEAGVQAEPHDIDPQPGPSGEAHAQPPENPFTLASRLRTAKKKRQLERRRLAEQQVP